MFIFFVLFEPYFNNYSNRTKFDSEKWQNWEENEATLSLRWNMIADLETKYELIGMKDSEILELLGEPNSKSDNEWTYYLGMAGYGIDIGTLHLSFNNGKVIDYEIARS